MLFEFVLFLILGLCIFVPLQEKAKMVAMIIFIVMMALWVFFGMPTAVGNGGWGHLFR